MTPIPKKEKMVKLDARKKMRKLSLKKDERICRSACRERGRSLPAVQEVVLVWGGLVFAQRGVGKDPGKKREEDAFVSQRSEVKKKASSLLRSEDVRRKEAGIVPLGGLGAKVHHKNG